MNAPANAALLKAAQTYNAAADHFDDAPLGFWDRHGRRSVELLNLKPGEQVLDAGCGTGASAIPAARAVGPNGRVMGIDVADNMLALGRAKAKAQRLDNVDFVLMDMANTLLPSSSCDVVLSVFSVFFVPDIEGQVAELWRLVRPGGRLGITVWGSDVFEPGASIFSEEVQRVRPDLKIGPRPWERLTDADGLRRLMRDGGTTEPHIHAMPDSQPLATPDAWWVVALGSGYRWEIEQLTADERALVEARTVARLKELDARTMGSSALCAIATKACRDDRLNPFGPAP